MRLRGEADTGHSVKRRLLLFSINVAIVTVYLVLGGVAMQALEESNEEQQREDLSALLVELNLTADQRKTLHDAGICNFGRNGHELSPPKWTLSGSIFYAMTVITTIGYGSLAPSTYNGRSFTVIYAIVGIGIVAQLLGSCAGILLGMGKAALYRLSCVEDEKEDAASSTDPWMAWRQAWGQLVDEGQGSFHLHRLPDLLEALSGQAKADMNSEVLDYVMQEVAPPGSPSVISLPDLTRAVALWYRTASAVPQGVKYSHLGGILVTCALWVVVWAFAFTAIEGWQYRESLWFCVVTMSTIGFGDFTPERSLGRALAFVFIIPGLGLSAACLGGIWQLFEERRFWLLQRLVRGGTVSEKLLEAHDINLFLSPSAGKQSCPPTAGFTVFSRFQSDPTLVAPLNSNKFDSDCCRQNSSVAGSVDDFSAGSATAINLTVTPSRDTLYRI